MTRQQKERGENRRINKGDLFCLREVEIGEAAKVGIIIIMDGGGLCANKLVALVGSTYVHYWVVGST